MQVFSNLNDVQLSSGTAVTIGKFDGVHIGHIEILRQLCEVATARNLIPTVVTFDRQPAAVVNPESVPHDLTGLNHRLELLAQAGVAATVVLPFSPELAALSPEEFVQTVLVKALNAHAILVGKDFRFGAHAVGDVELLAQLGQKHGFDVHIIDDVAPVNGVRASSSGIRSLLAEGNVAEAATLLGRYPCVTGEVVHGAKRGRELGFPTANLSQDSEGIIPADGVYAGWLTDGGVRYPAAISVGTNPTFEGVNLRTVEAFVLDETLDLYGHTVTVEFVGHIRGMVAFAGIEPLIEQMHEDVVITRRILEEA